MERIPGYDDWKTRTPEDDAASRCPKHWTKYNAYGNCIDCLRDARLDAYDPYDSDDPSLDPDDPRGLER